MKKYLIYIIIGVSLFIIASIAVIIWIIHPKNKPSQPSVSMSFCPGRNKDHTMHEHLEEKESHVERLEEKENEGFFCPLAQNKKDNNLYIPKIIHQIWHNWSGLEKDNQPIKKWQQYTQILRENHPEWGYKLWNNENSLEFVKEYYPWFLPIYNGYEHGMKRGDSLRYLLMHHFGGVYIDMGFDNFKNIEPLLLGQFIVVPEQDRGDQYPEGHSIATGFQASVPNHPFYEYLIDKLTENKDNEILEATGPAFLTKHIHQYIDENPNNLCFKILDKKYLFPYLWNEKTIQQGKTCRSNRKECQKMFPDAYMVNHWRGSWLKPELQTSYHID